MNNKNYDYEKIKNLKDSGLTWLCISKEFGVSIDSIRSVYRRKNKIIEKNKKIENKTIEIENYCLYCNNQLYNKKQKYCNLTCKNNHYHKLWVDRWKNGLELGFKGEYGISKHIRRYLFEKYNNECSICNWGEKNPTTNTIPLEIEHIDGNYKNNSEENLKLLCPNCHSLTSTYKGANKGNGRKGRK